MQSAGRPRKKALCIGIKYTHHEESFHLRGSHNDALEMAKLLSEFYGYEPSDIVVLIDGDNDSTAQPTKDHIIKAMKALVKDAKPNDHLFFHYSGHGKQIKDENGDESDEKDEAIYPVDFEEMQKNGKIVGYITDDEMHEIMVKPLPAGCRLTAVLDACHSGTGLDLPYVYSTAGKVKGTEPGFPVRRSAANVVSWSGCKDSKRSADMVKNNKAFGAMCNAFMTVLRSNRDQSVRNLLLNIREYLEKKGFSQEPQLSCSHEKMDTNITFVC